MLPTVSIRLLGAFEVSVNRAAPVTEFPTRRSGELVQLLALAPGHRLVRDQVMEALWPQLTTTAGGANLRKAAHHARRALGDPGAVRLHHQVVELFPDASVRTDVEEFVDAADAAIASADPAEARAVALRCPGDLLPASRYEPWTDRPRRLVASRHLDLLRVGAQWDRVLELDPLDDESAAREVMREALRSGQRHRSIMVYGRLRSALSADLAVAPGPETERVYAESLAGLVAPAVPFFGREHESATLDALVRGASGSAVVLVRGPSGIGRSAFVKAAVSRAHGSGYLAVLIPADAPRDAFATLAAVVAELFRCVPSVKKQLSERTRAVLARLTRVPQSAEAETPLSRHQLMGAVSRLVRGAAGRVVIVVDDAHRADASSLEVLAQLTEDRAGPVVVLACRSEAAEQSMQRAIARAARHGALTSIDLGPLDHASLRSLAASLGAPADDASVEALALASNGNAFFAVELCKAGTGGDLPPSLVDAIGSRFLDLDREIIAWLRRVSLGEGPLELGSVGALAGCTEHDLSRLLDTAIAAGVLTVDRGTYRFCHELVRRTLSDQVAPHHRVTVHRAAALRLAELGARPGLVAHHWLEGGRPGDAVEWLFRAADEAISLGGYPAALAQLDRILEHFPDHAEALRRRASALDATGDPRCVAAYDDAVRVAGTDEVHELRPLQALAMVKLGDPEGGMRVVAGAEPRRLESQLAKALAYCGAGLMGHADPDIGARLAAEGRRRALGVGDPSSIMVASWAQAGAAHARGELRTSLHTDLHDTRTLPHLAVSVFDGQLCIAQRLLYGSRPYHDVIRWAEAFGEEAERLGAARGRAFAATLRGEAELLSGDLDASGHHLRRGRELHHDLGAAAGEAFSLQRLAELAGVRGDLRTAQRLLDEALAVARESDVGFHLLDRIYGTRITLATQPEEGVAMVDEAEELVSGPFETCPGCRITLAVPAALALVRGGELDRALEYEASCAWLAGTVMQLPAWYAALDEVRAHRCIAQGDLSVGRDHLRDAVRGFRGAGQPHDTARCAADLSRLEFSPARGER